MVIKALGPTVAAIFSTLHLLTASPVSADELSPIRERLVAARTQDDFARIYESIEHKFNGDTRKIVQYLRDVGFSCQYGKVLFKAKCVFAYCGDRKLFMPTLRRELMSIGVNITEGGTSTGVVHHQTMCPATDALLRETQKNLLN